MCLDKTDMPKQPHKAFDSFLRIQCNLFLHSEPLSKLWAVATAGAGAVMLFVQCYCWCILLEQVMLTRFPPRSTCAWKDQWAAGSPLRCVPVICCIIFCMFFEVMAQGSVIWSYAGRGGCHVWPTASSSSFSSNQAALALETLFIQRGWCLSLSWSK